MPQGLFCPIEYFYDRLFEPIKHFFKGFSLLVILQAFVYCSNDTVRLPFSNEPDIIPGKPCVFLSVCSNQTKPIHPILTPGYQVFIGFLVFSISRL